MSTNPHTEDEIRRAFAAHLERLGEQCRRLARMLPADRGHDESTIRIVQRTTRRFSLMSCVESELLDGALALAARGYRVFPVSAATFDEEDRSNGKTPLLKGWPVLATTDKITIHAWWTDKFRGANVGIATGVASGVTVVDLDLRLEKDTDGLRQLRSLEEQHGDVLTGPIARRGSGAHLHFAYEPVLRSVNAVLPGIDLKNDGGYVVAPPSIHRTGDRYTWAEGTSDLALPTMPQWLVEAFMPRQKSRMRSKHVQRGHAQGSTNAIDLIRSSITVDDVLEHFDLPSTPSKCPLHRGADNPKAFTSYAGNRRWHCFTNCAEGENDGDTIDLIRRLEDCTFDLALMIAATIGVGEEALEPADGGES